MREVDGVRPMVGVPLERAISHADQVVPWLVGIAQQGWAFVFQGFGRTDVTRNRMAEHFIECKDFTHLVMLDLDHGHPLNVVWQLCKRAAEGLEVVSALAFRRGEPYEPMAFRYENGTGLAYAVTEWERGAVEPVDVLGFGAVIIARSVLERLERPWFQYAYRDGHYPTEDIHFCQECRKAGIGLYVDFGLATDHLIVSPVNERVFRAHMAVMERNAPETGA